MYNLILRGDVRDCDLGDINHDKSLLEAVKLDNHSKWGK
ncbi:hypothetical protein ymoll0001_22140 [Yersinia mollaretii ATCC 43969]|uniref:Uncharacterized protein n=1 Tax=Yersinia mollaretii (strain ATCC 43969 / DSM 18520 / CIP 103324 / CNY 7263 / WAIP 204) TaxID=349967 RepID=A0ABP2EKZ4_YERMW|nr:hypothetical protein ymoll0001_22140 [Yersinia mollaretii ATCC 43969]